MGVLTGLFGMTDEQAMWRVQMHDDNDAFATLLSRWEEPIKRLCIRMLGDSHKAEDVTQEAFSRIYTRRKEFLHGSKFSTFLWRVAMNLCLDELRRVKRRREISAAGKTDDSGDFEIWDQVASEERPPDSKVELEEQAEMVRRAVTTLPEHYRSVVILRHYQDLKFREISDVLGVPEGTVKSRMFEALEMLNRSMHKQMNESAPAKNNAQKEIFVL
jgi:RNA polymerase sigma-70 factor, ECF subfamily